MHLRFAAALLILCSLAAPPVLARGVNSKLGYVDVFRETMRKLVQADDAMYEQMRVIARKLEEYYLRTGHLPYAGPQQEKFKAAVERETIQNPYQPQTTELYYRMKLQDDGRVKMWFLNDSFLSKEQIKECRQQAPKGWSADPGTIMVMVNGEGTYAIWASSADRLPLRDYQHNGRTRIICYDLAVEFAKQPQQQ